MFHQEASVSTIKITSLICVQNMSFYLFCAQTEERKRTICMWMWNPHYQLSWLTLSGKLVLYNKFNLKEIIDKINKTNLSSPDFDTATCFLCDFSVILTTFQRHLVIVIMPSLWSLQLFYLRFTSNKIGQKIKNNSKMGSISRQGSVPTPLHHPKWRNAK